MQKKGYIYILTNKNKTVLYVGVTAELQRRIYEHRTHYQKGSFTDKYNLEHCVYFESFLDIEQAICCEKELKKWNRNKKEELINELNPKWNDLW